MLDIPGLNISNLVFSLKVVIKDGYAHEVKASVTGQLVIKSHSVSARISLMRKGTTSACLHLSARNLGIFDLLSPILGVGLSSKLSSSGFPSLVADFMSLDLAFGSNEPASGVFHVHMRSLMSFGGTMFEGSSAKKTTSYLNRNLLFGKFRIMNVNATVVLKNHCASFSVQGDVTLPILNIQSTVDLTVANLGSEAGAYHALKFQVGPQMDCFIVPQLHACSC